MTQGLCERRLRTLPSFARRETALYPVPVTANSTVMIPIGITDNRGTGIVNEVDGAAGCKIVT